MAIPTPAQLTGWLLFALLLLCAGPIQAQDSDSDGVPDASDNCPVAANADQADHGGVFSDGPDGIGDSCQCGDVSGDGRIRIDDWVRIARIATGLGPELPRPELCFTGIDRGPCDAADGSRIRRSLAGQIEGIQQACAPGLAPFDCSARFVPHAGKPGQDTALIWSSAAAAECTLRCFDVPWSEVPCHGNVEKKIGDPNCTLYAKAAPGVTAKTCSAVNLATDPACTSIPSCTLQWGEDANGDPRLSMNSDALLCSYACEDGAHGSIPCAGTLDIGPGLPRCRAWAASSCFAVGECSTAAWSTPILLDGELDDWPLGTELPFPNGRAFASWDSANFYLGLEHAHLATGDPRYGVMIFFGGDLDSGPGLAPLVGSQQGGLPIPFSHVVLHIPATGASTAWTLNASGDYALREEGLAAIASEAIHGGGPSIEYRLQLPFAGFSNRLKLHVDLVDMQAGNEWTYNALPSEAHFDGFMGPERGHAAAWQFELQHFGSPAASGIVYEPYFPEVTLTVPPENTAHSLRILTYNTAMIDIPDLPITLCVLANCVVIWPSLFIEVDNEEKFGMSDEDRALEIAAGILRANIDVVALNEVFDEDARDALHDALSPHFPHVVKKVDRALSFEVGSGGDSGPISVFNVQDSGLMLFSKFPFEPLTDTGHLAPDGDVEIISAGTTLDNDVDRIVAFHDYTDQCAMPDCLGAKGTAMVRIRKSADEIFNVAFTHLEASYDSDDARQAEARFLNRASQLSVGHQVVEESLTDQQALTEKTFFMGDLNVKGRFSAGSDDAVHDYPGHPGSLGDGEIAEWDQSRQEWLFHFCGLREPPFAPQSGDFCFNHGAGQSFLPTPLGTGPFGCGDGTQASCPDPAQLPQLENFFVDSWAFDSSPRDLGQTNGAGFEFDRAESCADGGVLRTRACAGERLDYILHNLPGHGAGDRESICAQHMTIAWEIGSHGGLGQHSDHLPLRGDYNRWAPHCRPREALEVALGGGTTSLTFDGVVQFPGSMQWLVITNPGAYSINLPNDRFAYDVYAATDLSRPLTPYHEERGEFGERYVLTQPPYYVRVWAQKTLPSPPRVPDREYVGPYIITVHLHSCTDDVDSCPLLGGDTPFPFIWPGDQPLNPEDAAWFDFYTDVDDENVFPTLHYLVAGSWISNYRFQVVESAFPFDVVLDSEDADPGNDFAYGPLLEPPNRLLAHANNLPGSSDPHGQKYFLKLFRREILEPGGNPCVLSPCTPLPEDERTTEVSWTTNLTYFYPRGIIVHNQEDDAIGPFSEDDELFYLVEADASPTTSIHAGFGTSDVAERGEPWPADMLGIHRYAQNLEVNLIEGGANDDETYFIPRSHYLAEDGEPISGCIGSTICPLRRERAVARARAEYWDAADPDDRDYHYVVTMCLRHEHGGPSSADCNH